MSQIEVPDWVAAEVLSRYSALRIERGDSEPWPPELASEQRQEDMRAALTAALGAWVVREPYRVGNRYMTQGGEEVTLNQVANYGTSYESMCDDAGVHRYTRRDFGRVTGSAHDYSDQRNIPPLYTLRQEKPE